MSDALPSAAEVLTPDALGPDTRVTPRVSDAPAAPVPPAPEAATAPAAPEAAASVPSADDFGVAHDPARHESPPALVRVPGSGGKRRWRVKRGNPGKAATVAPSQPTSAPVSKIVIPPTTPTPGEQAAQGLAPAPLAEVLTVEDYRPTGRGLTALLFSGLRIAFGKAWVAESDESDRWTDCLARLWHGYGFPRLGGFAELVGLGLESWAKRSDDTTTRQRIGGMFRWFGFRKDEPKPLTTPENQS